MGARWYRLGVLAICVSHAACAGWPDAIESGHKAGVQTLCDRGRTEVYVDDSAAPGGDGSAQRPLQTIQAGVGCLAQRGGTVLIRPGTYFGPIVIERDNVSLRGLAEPVYDAEGFLAGFSSDDPDDEEVVVTLREPLSVGSLAQAIEPEDLIELRGSHLMVRNLVTVLPASLMRGNAWSSAVSAKAEDADFYEGIVFSHILVRGWTQTVGWTRNANVLFEQITSLEPGWVGLNPGGNGHVEVHRSHLANKTFNVCYLSLWEAPNEENGPSHLSGVVSDSLLRQSNSYNGFEGTGLFVAGRGSQTNPAETSSIVLEVHRSAFVGNLRGIKLMPLAAESAFSTRDTQLSVTLSGNTYAKSHIANVEVDFRVQPVSQTTAPTYAASSSVTIVDGDGKSPDPDDVNLGPADNGNEYRRVLP